MADLNEEQGDFDWRVAMAQLREGKGIEIPCNSDNEFQRRQSQIAKRAEKQGIDVDIQRGEGVLRIEPRAKSSSESGESDRQAARGDRRRERAERRDTVRSERGPGPNQEP